jgi:hypothetical protein
MLGKPIPEHWEEGVQYVLGVIALCNKDLLWRTRRPGDD